MKNKVSIQSPNPNSFKPSRKQLEVASRITLLLIERDLEGLSREQKLHLSREIIHQLAPDVQEIFGTKRVFEIMRPKYFERGGHAENDHVNFRIAASEVWMSYKWAILKLQSESGKKVIL